MKIALTGASGFVGQALQKHFKDVCIINRNDSETDILLKLEDVDVVINLAGAPIIKRWTETYKKILFDSRIDSTQKLVNALNKSTIKHFISTSAIGIYPNNNGYDEYATEYSHDFLGKLTQQWEAEALKCNKPTSILRFGVILGKNGGALAQMLTPFKLGLGGTIGNGKMMTSWIHMDDLIGIYQHIINHQLLGIYNATAPNPVTNHTFTKTLGKVLNRPTPFPLPIFILKMLFGEGASVLTASTEIYPTKLLESGYNFRYTELESTLISLV